VKLGLLDLPSLPAEPAMERLMTPLVLAVLLAAADPGAGQAPGAQAPSPAPPAQAAKPAKDPNKIVCRSEEQVGTRVRVRKCMTQQQWDGQDEQTRQYFQDALDHGALNTAKVNSGQPGG
jgi:hypothetical protein